MFCGVVGASGSIVEVGRAVRGELCRRAVRGESCGVGWVVGWGVVPMWGCVSGDDGVDAVLSGLGVRAGCAVGLFAVIVVVRRALLPS